MPFVEYFPPHWTGHEIRAVISRILMNGFYDPKAELKLGQTLAPLYLDHEFTFFNSGKSAIYALLKSWNIGPGDEVLVPAFICDSVIHAVQKTGATPVDVDVSPSDLNISPMSVKDHINSKSKAVIVAHLYGNPADLGSIPTSLRIMDDAAQSFGAKLNGRYLGQFGDGGLIGIGPGKSTAGPRGGIAITEEPLSPPSDRDSFISIKKTYSSFLYFRCWRSLFFPIVKGLDFLRSLKKPSKASGLFSYAKMDRLDATIARLEINRVLDSLLAHRKKRHDELVQALNHHKKIRIIQAQRGESSYVKFVFVLEEGDPNALFKRLQEQGIEVYPSYQPTLTYRRSTLASFFADSLKNRVFEFPTNLSVEKTKKMADLISNGLSAL